MRIRPALALVAACVTLIGCQAPAPGSPAAIGLAALINSLAGDAGQTACSRNLAPAPRNNNDHLVPIAVNPSGTKATQDQVVTEFALVSGRKVASLPRTAEATSTRVHLHRKGGTYQVLGFGRQLLDDGEDTDEGLGATMPAEEEEAQLDDPTETEEGGLYEAASEAEPYHVFAAPPSAWDLRDHQEGGLMPPVRDQRQRGTCVLHSSAGYLDYLYRVTDPRQGASPQFMYWLYHLNVLSKIPDQTRSDGTVRKYQSNAFQNVGTSTSLFHPCLKLDGNRDVSAPLWPYIPVQLGTLSEEEVPYQPKVPSYDNSSGDYDALAVSVLGQAATDKIRSGQPLTSHGAFFTPVKLDIASYEAALSGGQPIQVAYSIYSPDWSNPTLVTVPALNAANDAHFNQTNADANGGEHLYSVIPELSDAHASDKSKLGGHSVLLVGYVREKSAPGGGYFIVRNSWSEGWADQGYALISYDMTLNYCTEGFVATAYSPFHPSYKLAPPPDEPPPAETVPSLPPFTPETPQPSQKPLPSPSNTAPLRPSDVQATPTDTKVCPGAKPYRHL